MKIFEKPMLLVTLLFLFATIACSKKKDDPTPSLVVEVPSTLVTTYTGSLSYTDKNGTVKANEDKGKATLTKNGSTYTLSFSDGVPSVSGLKFSQANGAYATIGTDGSISGVSIQDPKMDIGVSKDGNNWAFSGVK